LDVTPELADYLTVTIADAATGRVTGRIEWDDSLEAGVNYRFRIQVSLSVQDDSTNLIEVTYQ